MANPNSLTCGLQPKLGAVTICLWLLLGNAICVEAKLNGTTLRSLIKESDLIAFVYPQQITFGIKGMYIGSALCRASDVVKGSKPSGPIQITWTAEVHDQRIDRLATYLVFLKKMPDGHYVATRYGISYWLQRSSLVNGADRKYFSYVYPLALATTPNEDSLIREQLVQPSEYSGSPRFKASIIFSEDLIGYISKLGG